MYIYIFEYELKFYNLPLHGYSIPLNNVIDSHVWEQRHTHTLRTKTKGV